MLQINNFSKVYPNGKYGAKNINLEIKSGDIFAFIGQNGAGKTTTIKSIVGINDLTEGDILIDNISIKSNPLEAKKNIAYVPDNPDIYNSLTGLQYINLVADVFRVNKEIREKIVKEPEVSVKWKPLRWIKWVLEEEKIKSDFSSIS